MRITTLRVGIAVALSSSLALAQQDRTADTEAPAEPDSPASAPADDTAVAGARQFLSETIGLVEKAKWKDLKARIHPFTLKLMEERQKRTKRDDHNLSFWTHVKEWKIEKWEITALEPGARGTAVATTREDHFMIEEKGHDEGKDAEWLLGKVSLGGKEARWWILDRKEGTGNFSATTIEKTFGDILPAPVEAAAPADGASPVAAYQKKLEGLVRAKATVPEDIPDSQLKVMRLTIKVMIDDRGAVQSRVVSRPSGNPAFDRAFVKALDAVAPFPAPPAGDATAKARDGLELTFRGKN
ncbi:MAG: TonB family protein [Deltaproteobacteria bacterium]|nr:TonB family protein [Deltaproteobacteria bacterium]